MISALLPSGCFFAGKCHSPCFLIGSSVIKFAIESILLGRPCGNPSLSGPNFTTNMSPFPQSTKVDWLAVEFSRQQKDFAQILELVMWIRAIWFVVGAHVSIHSCDFTNGNFQGQETDRILLCRIPVEGIRELGVASRAILASRVPVCGTTDAGRGCDFD